MNQVVPPRFLFRWSFFARKSESLPHSSGRLLALPDDCALPSLGELDQRLDFAQVKLAWNERGIGVSLDVSGKVGRQADEVSNADGIRLWFDMRNTQNVHRATKFCQHYIVHPTGGGSKKRDPLVRSAPIPRARDEVPLPNAKLVMAQSEITKSGYWLDAWFPAEALVGFDPASHSKIGFHYVVQDSERGEQSLAVGSEFPYESDPSLWQTVELR